MGARKTIFLGIILALVVAGVFLPAIHNGFAGFDDSDYVTGNPVVRSGLSWHGIAWAFRAGQPANWHPVTWISHMADCQFFGLDPRGHHLSSVVLHAINSMLLFLILRGMTGAAWRSLFVAALFGLHPLRVESVAWIAERKDLLSGFFFLLTVWAYRSYATNREERPALWYCLALFFFVMGLMSKPMLVTLPLVLLLLDYWPLSRIEGGGKRQAGRLVVEKLPFFALAAASAAVTYLVQRSAGAMLETSGVSLPVRTANALVSYLRYIGNFFWPANLAAHYPYPARGWPVWKTVLAAAALSGVSAAVILSRKQRPYLLTGWFWHLVMLAPVIGVVQVGAQSMADRYTYLPMIGIAILLTWGVSDLTRGMPMRKTALGASALLILAGCSAATRVQIGYWKDCETIFRRALAVTNDNWKAENNLGFALLQRGAADEATGHFEAAIRIRGDYATAQYNLGVALADKRRFAEAIPHYQECLKLEPARAEARNNLGVALAVSGRTDEAIAEYRKALELQPDYAKARRNLGVELAGRGRISEAISEYREALRLNPDDPEAHNDLGAAFYAQRRMDDAIAEFREALRLSPDQPEARHNLDALLRMRAAGARGK